MELRNLKTFLQIVESESFTKAAENLGYTQSTVSFQIRQIEEELGCRLFDRINHSISLTDNGQRLLTHALKVVRAAQTLTDDFVSAEKPAGTVRMVSSDSICEKMMLLNYAEFYNTYPDIKLVFSTANTNDMIYALSHHEADVIFTLDSHIYDNNYVIARESPVALHFVTAADSPLAGRGTLDVRELLPYPFIMTEANMSYRKLLDERLAEESLQLSPVLETGRTDIILRSLTGGGISWLPDFVTDEHIQNGTLVRLDVRNYHLTIWKQLIYHKEKWISKSLRAFLDFVMAHEFEW